MKTKKQHIFGVVLLFIAMAVFLPAKSSADEDSRYLKAVRKFADNVLKYGRDTIWAKAHAVVC
ncbi:hypothetical protein KA005_36420 [bacterium]|nr:hypothetical protein [bacterium]